MKQALKQSMKGYKMIATKSLFSWLKVGFPGLAFSFICLIVAIFLLAMNNVPEHTGLNFYYIFLDKPLATILIICSILFAVLYVILANKYALMTLLNLFWNNKLGDFIIPKIQQYVQKLTDKQPDWLKGLTSSKLVRIFMDVIRQDGTLNKVQRLVLTYGVKGMKLNKNDFELPEYEISHVVVEKIESKIAQITTPSITLYLLLLILHLILLVLALIFT